MTTNSEICEIEMIESVEYVTGDFKSYIDALDFTTYYKFNVINCSEKYHYVVQYKVQEHIHNYETVNISMIVYLMKFLKSDSSISKFICSRNKTHDYEEISYYLSSPAEPYDYIGEYRVFESASIYNKTCELCKMFGRRSTSTLMMHKHNRGLCHHSSKLELNKLVKQIPAKLSLDICRHITSYL